MENNTYYYGAPTQGQGYYDNPATAAYFGYQPTVYQNVPVPQNVNALTDEEIKALRSARPTSKIDLNIDRNDVLRAMCTHKDHGKDVVVPVNDESGDVYCPICQERWNPNAMTKEEIMDLVETLVGQMENAKWTGDLPVELTRELFTLIPLLRKFPDVYEYALNTFNKYYSQRGMVNAADTSVYAQYNALLNPGYGYGAPAAAPAPGYGYGAAAPAASGTGYYYGQMPAAGAVPVGAPANPGINPMQAPVGAAAAAPAGYVYDQYGRLVPAPVGTPAPAPAGYVYDQYGRLVPAPVGTPAPAASGQQTQAPQAGGQAAPTGAPAYAPTFAAPGAAPAGDTKTKDNADGTTTSETKIDL